MEKCINKEKQCDNWGNSKREGLCNSCFHGWRPFGPSYDDKPEFPEPRVLKAVTLPENIDEKKMRSLGIKPGEDASEYLDQEEMLEAKVEKLAQVIKDSSYLVVYTGAGVSTSADISDFRGPDGVWTRRAKGTKAKKAYKSVADAKPTLTHMAIKTLIDKGVVKHLTSTNCDGLHLRSGVPLSKLSELHGNSYKEICQDCGKAYYRSKPVPRSAARKYSGRICDESECSGKLRRSTVAFGESLPRAEYSRAREEAYKSDLALVLGTSMRVTPANSLPEHCWYDGRPGKLVICNLQKGPYDKHAYFNIFGRTDQVMQMLMEKLDIPIQPYSEEDDFTFAQHRSK